MMEADESEISALFAKLDKEAKEAGYNLNPDSVFTLELIEGLVENQKRYGYLSCPCRLASGSREEDLDIVCPCDYRDPDLSEFGSCYCALYVSDEINKGEKYAVSVPERRPPKREDRPQKKEPVKADTSSDIAYPVWRCRVCGYLAARDEPPGVCPICKATKDRFERFM